VLLIYTGNGKGKTSACVGQVVRAFGQGLRVAFGQFMKKDGQAGEQKVLSELLGARFLASGAGFFRNVADYPRHREKAEALLGWAQKKLDEGVDLLVLDEILYALGHDLVRREEVESLVGRCSAQGCHLVLSGRGAPDWLVEMADIVSDIREVKHIHAQGGPARPGIEF